VAPKCEVHFGDSVPFNDIKLKAKQLKKDTSIKQKSNTLLKFKITY